MKWIAKISKGFHILSNVAWYGSICFEPHNAKKTIQFSVDQFMSTNSIKDRAKEQQHDRFEREAFLNTFQYYKGRRDIIMSMNCLWLDQTILLTLLNKQHE